MAIPREWTFENTDVASGFDRHVREQLAAQQALKVDLQVLLILVRGYSVHARGAILAGTPVRFLEPVNVHQVG
jgi:hypothetical protein